MGMYASLPIEVTYSTDAWKTLGGLGNSDFVDVQRAIRSVADESRSGVHPERDEREQLLRVGRFTVVFIFYGTIRIFSVRRIERAA
jgi:hypothetical protein